MDTKEKDAWLKALKEKLDDYSEPVPQGGWERLQKELNRQALPKRPLLLQRRWLNIAAAVALILASGTIGIYLDRLRDADSLHDTKILQTNIYPDIQPERALPEQKLRPVSMFESPTPVKKRTEITPAEATDTTQTNTESLETIEENIAERGETVMQTSHSQQKKDTKHRQNYQPATWQRTPLLSQANSKRDKKWSMSLSVGNATGGNGQLATRTPHTQMSRINMVTISNNMLDIPDGQQVVFSEGLPYLQPKNNEIEIEHHQPISAGIALRKNLTKRFSIETGLVYTLLVSDITLPSNTQELTQRLHYLGIPLRANVDFFSNRLVTLYASAGGMIEKCVYGTFDGERETVKHPQYSLLGAIGAQVNLTHRMGIYAEPGVSYYFDDGSEVETIRKENPLTFTLQAGLRWTY